MADAFLGEIRMFGGNYAPVHWAKCQGQLLAINQNQALYSLIGTTYGGDGMNTFALPDLRGRLPMGFGEGTGLTNRNIGDKVGTEGVTLTVDQIPNHIHIPLASTTQASLENPTNAMWGGAIDDNGIARNAFIEYDHNTMALSDMNENIVSETGSNIAHTNMMPYCVLNFIICLQGEFPQRQ